MQMRLLCQILVVIGLVALAAPLAPKRHAAAQETAPAAKLWPTDAPVRDGMIAIRDLVRVNHSLVTHRRMPPDHAKRFAAQIKIEAERMLATSKMKPNARESLRALLADIVAGIGSVAEGGSTALDGLTRATAALERYPSEFDHPGWVALQTLE
jgi:hypothetical protein